MSAISENIPVNYIRPEELCHQLETACKFAFLQGAHQFNSNSDFNDLYDSKAIGFASTFFSMPRHMTYWFTVLAKLDLLPPYVPTLPENFFEIYFGNCPIMEMEGKLKKDGTPYELYETHSLFLIPPNSLADLDRRAAIYRQDELEVQRNIPLPPNSTFIRWMSNHEYTLIQSNHWEWVLTPNEALEDGFNKTYLEQTQVINTLNEKVTKGPNYCIGTAKQIATFHCFYRIAKGMLNDEVTHFCYYMDHPQLRVAREFGPGFRRGYHRTVNVTDYRGAPYPFILFGGISQNDDYAGDGVGIAILRNLSRVQAEDVEDLPSKIETETSCVCIIN